MTQRSPMARLFAMTAGLLAWAAQFTVIYAVTAVICARGYGGESLAGFGIVPLTIVIATLLALGATALLLVLALRERRRLADDADANAQFVNYLTLIIAGFSLVAIVWQGLPGLIVPACP